MRACFCFRIISFEHQLITKLGKEGLNTFANFCKYYWKRIFVMLIISHSAFQPDLSGIKKVKLIGF